MSFFNRIGEKVDKRSWGIILGASLPIITFIILWQLKLGDHSLKQAFQIIKSSMNSRSVLTFPIVPNLFLFYFSNFRLKWYQFSTGLVAMTISFAILIAVVILF